MAAAGQTYYVCQPEAAYRPFAGGSVSQPWRVLGAGVEALVIEDGAPGSGPRRLRSSSSKRSSSLKNPVMTCSSVKVCPAAALPATAVAGRHRSLPADIDKRAMGSLAGC